MNQSNVHCKTALSSSLQGNEAEVSYQDDRDPVPARAGSRTVVSSVQYVLLLYFLQFVIES